MSTKRRRAALAALQFARAPASGRREDRRGGLAARALVAAVAAAVAPVVDAHEFECRRTAGYLEIGPSGAPTFGVGGLPVFTSQPSSVLTVRSYPALLGFRVDLANVASEPSVVTGVTDTLLAALGGSARTFGDAIGPGFSLPVGASATQVHVVAVASEQECLALFGGAAEDAPVCASSVEDRFTVQHDAGSAECRARVVCAPPAANGCGDEWHGIRQFGYGGVGGIALEPPCDVAVVGSDQGIYASLARFDASGTRVEYDLFAGGRGATGRAVAVDASGSRWVAWTQQIESAILQANVARIAPDETMTAHDFVVGGPRPYSPPDSTLANGVAVDASGNGFLVGTGPGVLPGFTSAGGIGVFAVKIDAATGTRAWAVQFGTSMGDSVGAAAVDPAGSLLVAGSTPGQMPGTDHVAGFGADDAFVAKIATDGQVVRVVQFGTSALDQVRGMAIDTAGNVYVSGMTTGTLPGNVSPGAYDAFLAKLGPDLAPVWFRQFGAARAFADATSVAVGPGGDVWIAGMAEGALAGQTAVGSGDAFVERYDADGNLRWAMQFGAPEAHTSGLGIAVDATGTAFVTGLTDGSLGADTGKVFVAKLDPSGNLK